MVAATLSLVGVFVALYLSLWKLGLMGMMACGTGSCESVQLSPYAYILGIPVAFIGVMGYLTTFVLSMACLQPRFGADRRMVIALVAASGVGVVITGYLTYLEAFVIGAWCRWCLLSASIIVAIFSSSLFALRTGEQRVESPA